MKSFKELLKTKAKKYKVVVNKTTCRKDPYRIMEFGNRIVAIFIEIGHLARQRPQPTQLNSPSLFWQSLLLKFQTVLLAFDNLNVRLVLPTVLYRVPLVCE